MKFNYLARNQEGEMQNGAVEAKDQSAALKAIQDQGLIAVKLQPAEKAPLFSKDVRIFSGIKKKDSFVFFRQLSILIDADVPLVQSLRILAEQMTSKPLREVITETANDVDGGMSFSRALGKRPKVFSDFAVNLIKTGEVSGRLQECLGYLADHLEKEFYLISRVRGAMVYPLFILTAFLIVGILVMVLVIPQLTSILTEAGQDLPFTTKIVISVSDFLRTRGYWLLILAIAAGIFCWRYVKTPKGEELWHRAKLKIPIFGKILQKTYLARFADNLSALTKGGVSIIQSLNISGQVVGNIIYQRIIFHAMDEVKGGKGMSATFGAYKEFPPLFAQMISTGEKTGKLEVILDKLSSFYNKEVDNVVENLSTLIEPILLVALGIGVSILVFAVFMPIYNLAGSVG